MSTSIFPEGRGFIVMWHSNYRTAALITGLVVLVVSGPSVYGQQAGFQAAVANAQSRAIAGVGRGGALPYNGRGGGYRGAGWHGGYLPNPYSWGNPYYQLPDPYGGYLQGAASVINAQGQWLQDYQQSRVSRQQVKSAQIDNRRKAFDEKRYEEANTPSVEDLREQQRALNLRRALNDPPAPEIWSGKALNDLMSAILRQQSAGPVVPLDQATLSRINVTAGTGAATTGLLRQGGKLTWPPSLRMPLWKDERQQINSLVKTAVQQVQDGQQVDATVINNLSNTISAMQDKLKSNVDNMTANDFVMTRHYLLDLEQALQTLQSPNAANVVLGKWSARGRNVSELVQNMAQQGLHFAPADDGNQPAYTSLQRSMADYVMATPGYAAQTQGGRGPAPATPVNGGPGQ